MSYHIMNLRERKRALCNNVQFEKNRDQTVSSIVGNAFSSRKHVEMGSNGGHV